MCVCECVCVYVLLNNALLGIINCFKSDQRWRHTTDRQTGRQAERQNGRQWDGREKLARI